MKKGINTSKKLGLMAMFVAMGMVLQYVESLIVLSPIPGGKLGLANMVSLVNIFMFGGNNAMAISLLRAFLGTLLSGSVAALPYSLFGAFFSTAAMSLMRKHFYPKVSMVGISVVGAVFHNFAQVCVACVIFSSAYIFSYLPLLLLVSAASGAVTGYGAQAFGNRILKMGDTI